MARLLLEQGPSTAVAIAERLGLTVPAVRRHLEVLLADGEVTTREPGRGPRRRGRPARQFLLTDAGRARFGHAYDDLAVAALRLLAEHGGTAAVREFARRRAAALIGRHRASILAGHSTADRARALADALTMQGYAASASSIAVGGVTASEQLCQHHCPVAHVAAEFPELCEVETATFAELLGTHVQRLATIARGDAVCTTHVPLETGHGRQSVAAGADPGGIASSGTAHQTGTTSTTRTTRTTRTSAPITDEGTPA